MKNYGSFALAFAIIIICICKCDLNETEDSQFWFDKYRTNMNIYLPNEVKLNNFEVYKPKDGIWKIVFKNMIINHVNKMNNIESSYTNWFHHSYTLSNDYPSLKSDVFIYYDVPAKDAPIWEEECGSSDAIVKFDMPVTMYLKFTGSYNGISHSYWINKHDDRAHVEKVVKDTNKGNKCAQRIGVDTAEMKQLLPSLISIDKLFSETKSIINSAVDKSEFTRYLNWRKFESRVGSYVFEPYY